MHPAFRTSLGLAALCLALPLASMAADKRFTRNSEPATRPHLPLARAATGGGLAPTTWGFVSSYSGALYGTGYYPFQVDLTYAGTNSIYGYTYNYPSAGFVNEIRAIYAFDVSSLAGLPSPVWSSFMFDTRETPAVGFDGLSAFAEVALATSGATHSLQGSALFQGNGAANLDIYDAEDFENAAPFDNPELAFSGTGNTLIGTEPVTTNAVVPIDFDVSTAVEADLATDLGILKIGLQPAPGVVEYTITVTNNGPLPATGVVVSDTFPAALAYVSDTCGGTNTPPWTWNVGALAFPGNASCTVTLAVLVPGTIDNTATVDAPAQSDPTSNNDSSTATLIVIAATGVLDIPTVDSVGLALLAVLLAGLGFRAARRRQA